MRAIPGLAFLSGERVTLYTVEEEDVEFLRDGVNGSRVRISAEQVLPSNGIQERAWFEETSTSKDVVQLLVVVDSEEPTPSPQLRFHREDAFVVGAYRNTHYFGLLEDE